MTRTEQINWLKLDYLREGSQVQKKVYDVMRSGRFLEILQKYNPILVGTVPIGIEVPGSDLDVVCEVYDFNLFEQVLTGNFGHYDGFCLSRRTVNGQERMKANFMVHDWPIEIFGQSVPTRKQNGYKHMLIEYRMLR